MRQVAWRHPVPSDTLRGLRSLFSASIGCIRSLSLAAVGITMHDGGSLEAHLAAIFVSVVVLAGVVSALVMPPRRTRDAFR